MRNDVTEQDAGAGGQSASSTGAAEPLRVRTRWEDMVAANPGHSDWYIQRFAAMAAQGADLAGEARLVDAMVKRNARILDAGCGPGRVGIELASRGHSVVGVDVDPALIAEAERVTPEGLDTTWLAGDIAELDLPSHQGDDGFDVIVCAGNVMTFLAPGTERDVLAAFARHLAPGGRAVIGFGAGRGYEFADFLADASAAGLTPTLLLSTWDLRPFTLGSSDFLVAVLSVS